MQIDNLTMDIYLISAVILAGFACGFINTIAGSGSLITLPLLIFLGLPANVANGTNRVAIAIQNIVGVASFSRQGVLNFRVAIIYAVPAVIGSIVGANIAVDVNSELMERVIGFVMVGMIPTIIWKPAKLIQKLVSYGDVKKRILNVIVFFAIGVHGGFIQAGVGVFLLIGLTIIGDLDLVESNSIKLFIILCFTLAALYVFLINGHVNWQYGLLLSVGNGSGALVGSRMAVKNGEKFVRAILIAVVVVSAIKLLGFGL
ncbi:MAG TPA: integrase [Chloroflexi bacterium]|nr:integrase [Chloroflexota bacterium]